ncbi:GDSL-type esterase/lipase family protein [Danxiaibacter flavus]|uniref:GDSL-type esterase/lipase family protein n=1 Tax=Danxiaibacter flavus TaxID=3049108 RepID=A0ABV3ZJE7_9BACT|nr:GDSL-type esterase/lipase family protein [Chitinophagaceae bacterium DXS]
MKKIFTSALFFLSIIAQAQVKRITCIGASITEGARIDNRKDNSFPGQLQALLGENYIVGNFGESSTTMLKHGNYPYWNTDAYKAALKSSPDIVFVDLGGNDAKAINRSFYNELEQDTRDMIHSFTSLSSHPRVIVLLPLKSFETDTMQIWDKTIVEEVIPRIQKAAYGEGVELLDIHSLLTDKPELFADKIHPNKDGAEIIAKRLFQQITQNMDEQFDLFTNFKQPFTTTDFNGYRCAEFKINGHDCKVVQPKRVAKGKPWIWRARFWAHEPQTDIALLERGFHLIYCDVAELMGNNVAISTWNKFYATLRKAGLGQKGVMEGMSRGGVYALNWAAANPGKVSAVYVDNPLLDCRVLARDMDKDISQMTKDFMNAYHLKTKEDIQNFKGSPIDKTKLISKGHYPILILCAENDEYVPPGEQAIPFQEKMKADGGEVKVIIKKGFRHHPHSFPNPTPIVDFILSAVDKDFYLSQVR